VGLPEGTRDESHCWRLRPHTATLVLVLPTVLLAGWCALEGRSTDATLLETFRPAAQIPVKGSTACSIGSVPKFGLVGNSSLFT